MQNLSSKENFFIGVSLSNSSNYDSSICVLDRNLKIVLIDKFYYAQDIDYFFETSPYVKNSAVAISVPYDNRMLEGKWRIHCKNYKALFDNFKINKDDWTNRVSRRCSDTINNLKVRGITVVRCDINQLRRSYGLSSHFLSRTSIDCKNLQASLKIKYGFSQMPDNMLPASSLEAIIAAMFAHDYIDDVKTSIMFEIDGIPVLERKIFS